MLTGAPDITMHWTTNTTHALTVTNGVDTDVAVAGEPSAASEACESDGGGGRARRASELYAEPSDTILSWIERYYTKHWVLAREKSASSFTSSTATTSSASSFTTSFWIVRHT